jgi:hypothetical protein
MALRAENPKLIAFTTALTLGRRRSLTDSANAGAASEENTVSLLIEETCCGGARRAEFER